MYLNDIESCNKNSLAASLKSSAYSKRRMAKKFWSSGYGFEPKQEGALCPVRRRTIPVTIGGDHKFSLPTLLLLILVLLGQQQFGDCRYLPTRSHTDDLNKLRELMLQLLESNGNAEPTATVHFSQGLNPIAPVEDQSWAGGAAANWLNGLSSWNTNVKTLLRQRYPADVNMATIRKQIF